MTSVSHPEVVILGREAGLRLELMTYGATMRRLRLPTPDGPRDLILSFEDAKTYARSPAYCGGVIGRCANRVARSRFALDGEMYVLSANEGRHHLHGGVRGFTHRVWRVESIAGAATSATLGLHSPEGEDGYPGALDVRATFTVEAATLRVELTARTDRRTPVNLTTHPYFNLSGRADCEATRQVLTVAADAFLPIDAERLPLGRLAPVEGTPFDLRRPTTIGAQLARGHPQLAMAGGFDHAFLIADAAAPAARLSSPDSGVSMTVWTNQPSLQVYGGQGLATQHPGLSGICLEPQGLPNAVNESTFPSIILQPGDVYRNTTRYAFGWAPPARTTSAEMSEPA